MQNFEFNFTRHYIITETNNVQETCSRTIYIFVLYILLHQLTKCQLKHARPIINIQINPHVHKYIRR